MPVGVRSDTDGDAGGGSGHRHGFKDDDDHNGGIEFDFSDGDSDGDDAQAPGWVSDSSHDTDGDDDDADSEAQLDRQERRMRRLLLEQNLVSADNLYDPDADDLDEKWMQQQRRLRNPPLKQKPSASLSTPQQQQQPPTTDNQDIDDNIEPQRQTDAVLSCPMCFTTVCYDCQQHDTYHNQYRAMFVENCHVVQNQILRPDPTACDTNTTAMANDVDQNVYHPVQCDMCECEIAVMDHDEVYHFFNVIAE